MTTFAETEALLKTAIILSYKPLYAADDFVIICVNRRNAY